MEAAFKIPSDLQLLSAFRDLRDLLGDEAKAMYVWYLVWQELNMRAQEGQSVGRLHGCHVDSLLRTLKAVEPDMEKCRTNLFLGGIVKTRLLEADGEDYVCPRFILLNSQVGKMRKESMGGFRRAYLRRQEQIEVGSFREALLIDAKKFVDGDGNTLNGEQTQRVVRLIRSVDNALYQPDRQPMAYSEGLIQAALRVLASHTDEEINLICNDVSMHRGHPYLSGMTAEKLLPEFGGVTARLN